jgi:aspartate 1-decarboxylase
MKLRTEIYGLRITDACPEKEGIHIGRDVMNKTGLGDYDRVTVLCGSRMWTTHVVGGTEGEVCVCGSCSKHFSIGETLTVLRYGDIYMGEHTVKDNRL